ncbi:hypothetical protein ACFXPY_27345 [Streptomyces sp. NPDC059153]|uniref:hypothetical protein n=1 Tax=Streptomyces sp. NPDC059153 TaxID=3346743 RepID=UPI0036882683
MRIPAQCCGVAGLTPTTGRVAAEPPGRGPPRPGPGPPGPSGGRENVRPDAGTRSSVDRPAGPRSPCRREAQVPGSADTGAPPIALQAVSAGFAAREATRSRQGMWGGCCAYAAQ